VLAALIELAQGGTRETRIPVYGRLNCLGLSWDTVWPAILPALHHSNPEVREDAARFLMAHYPEEARSLGIGDFIPLHLRLPNTAALPPGASRNAATPSTSP